MARGKKIGDYHMGSFASAIRAAKPGTVFWVEGQQSSLSSTVQRIINRTPITQKWYAMHPSSRKVIPLIRIEIPRRE